MISASNYQSSDNRKVTIQVTGLCRQDIKHSSNYTITVSYSRLSKTIQRIQRMGAKIASVSIESSDIQLQELELPEPIAKVFPRKITQKFRQKSTQATKKLPKKRGGKTRLKSKMYLL